MANTVTLQVKINDNGDLQLLSSNAQKAAASTDKLGKATDGAGKKGDQFQKQYKGVAGATSNSTKAFSKMTTGITSGLVPAYAVLAANIFALTAAFGALQRAAAFQQLEEGLVRVGNAAGANLPYVAQQLKDITGSAISMEAAMSSTALAMSSGFSSSQLEQLTRVAKGASQALGRDMEDALTRLVKGTAKLEPEILDELGIMVRLDDATRTYATSIGKTESQLTQFERRQAFLNATIEQGTIKFGDIADSLKPNAYNQLSAAFADLTKEGLILVNYVLTPLVTFLASTPTALAGALLLFGTTILSTLIPALDNVIKRQRVVASAMSKEMKVAAAKGTSAFTQAASKINKLEFAPPSVKRLQKELLSGSVRGKQLATVLRNITKAEKLRSVAISSTAAKNVEAKQAELLSVQQLHAQVLALQRLETARGVTTVAAERAITASRLASAQAAALSMMAGSGAFKGLLIAFASIGKQIKHVAKAAGFMGKLAGGATLAKNAVGLLGRAFLNLIPGLGQVLFFGSMLYPLFKGMFGNKGSEGVSKQVEEIAKSFESFIAIGEQLRETLQGDATATEKFVATLKVKVGVLNQVKSGYEKYEEALKSTRMQELIQASKTLTAAEEALAVAKSKKSPNPRGLAPSSADEEKAVKAAREEVERLRATLNTIDKEAAQVITQAAMDNIRESPTLIENMGDKLTGLEGLLEKIGSGAIKTGKEFSAELDNIIGEDASSLASIEAAKTAMGDFNKEVAVLSQKASSPFDAVIEAAGTLRNEFYQAGKSGSEGFLEFKNRSKGLQEQIDRTRDILKLPMIISDAGTTDILAQTLIKNRDIIISSKALLKQQQAEQKRLNAVASTNPGIMQKSLTLGEAILDTKKNALDKEKENYALLGTIEDNSERILQINIELKTIEDQRLIINESSVRISLVQMQNNKRLNDLVNKNLSDKKAIFDIDQKMAKNAMIRSAAKSGIELTPEDELKHFNENKKARMEMINAEEDARLHTISVEYDLLHAQLLLEQIKAKRAGASKEELEMYTTIATLYNSNEESAKNLAEARAAMAVDNLNTEGATLGREALDASRTATGTMGQRIGQATGVGGALNPDTENATIGDKTAAAVNAMQPMLDLMGPEGALINSVAQGAIAITDAWSTAFKTMGDDGKMSMSAAMEAASATLGALGGMLAQASKDRIAGVDDEIAAEKKRDGNSAASVAKIKKLEAKKEAIKKKAFETDKKVKMAQTVMNTAAGIMNFMSDKNIPMAIATGVMGAIQLAVIAGTSYQGGGNSAPSGKPEALTMGKRTNTVDLARGNSAGGELAYMRGERGQGTGATNFKPGSAFTGAKYRASGGETAGFMVGEQGPEMFIPDRSGRIAPADETAAMSNVSNVNFNISAVDAAGVEDVLVRQKGHIIRMIREAANEHGQPFLETVSDGAYVE